MASMPSDPVIAKAVEGNQARVIQLGNEEYALTASFNKCKVFKQHTVKIK